jgi:hypothetical protein
MAHGTSELPQYRRSPSSFGKREWYDISAESYEPGMAAQKTISNFVNLESDCANDSLR